MLGLPACVGRIATESNDRTLGNGKIAGICRSSRLEPRADVQWHTASDPRSQLFCTMGFDVAPSWYYSGMKKCSACLAVFIERGFTHA